MTPDQFAKLLELLARIADRPYTISGAADWPIAYVFGGALFALIIFMWRDLRLSTTENRHEWKTALDKHELADNEENKILWQAIKDCQGECCPPRMQRKQ